MLREPFTSSALSDATFSIFFPVLGKLISLSALVIMWRYYLRVAAWVLMGRLHGSGGFDSAPLDSSK